MMPDPDEALHLPRKMEEGGRRRMRNDDVEPTLRMCWWLEARARMSNLWLSVGPSRRCHFSRSPRGMFMGRSKTTVTKLIVQWVVLTHSDNGPLFIAPRCNTSTRYSK